MRKNKIKDEVRSAVQGEVCPKCALSEIGLIIYGLILRGQPDLDEAVREGLVILGGCCVAEDNLFCRKCGHWFPDRKTRLCQSDTPNGVCECSDAMPVDERWIEKELEAWAELERERVRSKNVPSMDKTHLCAKCGKKVPFKHTAWVEGYGTLCFKCRHQLRQEGMVR